MTNVPAPAKKAGYTRLVFCDDFDSPETIDMKCTHAPGYKWYLDRPFGWADVDLKGIAVENSILTIKTEDHAAGWGPSSYSSHGRTGNSFRYGYFEAKIRFDPKLGVNASYFPAWWSFSVNHAVFNGDDQWAELDFFEAMPEEDGVYRGCYVATVHDWIYSDGKPGNHQNPNNWHPGVVNDDDWHVYGCLWMPGRIEWYFDGKMIAGVSYSADEMPVPLSESSSFKGCYSFMDGEDMLLILGTSADWPIEVDWVNVWQE